MRMVQAVEAISEMRDSICRLSDHFAPDLDIVDTPFVARKLAVSTTWVAEMVRKGKIPENCVVEGTGNGKPWKFYRRKIESWISTR